MGGSVVIGAVGVPRGGAIEMLLRPASFEA